MDQNDWEATCKNKNSWYVEKVGVLFYFPILKIYTLKLTSDSHLLFF